MHAYKALNFVLFREQEFQHFQMHAIQVSKVSCSQVRSLRQMRGWLFAVSVL